MKLGVMQPYFFPYLGYWQLMNAVDQYVIYDDVNYIKGGWINRNRILVNGKANFFHLPMKEKSPNKLINELTWDRDERKITKLLRTIEFAYKKAPQFRKVMPLIEKIFSFDSDKLAPFLINQLEAVKNFLEIETKFIVSSEIPKDNSLKGQDKLLAICEMLGASEYYNAFGGTELYSHEDFATRNIDLKFLKSLPPPVTEYRQFKNEFVPDLSIIDVMMFCDVKQLKKLLSSYILI